jgi:hypothetical protein
VIRHLSLRDWLRWIQASGSDAVLRVRTPDGGNGTIWCHAGKVVDAVWATLTRQAALKAMLGLPAGAVTIDFEPSDRPRRGASPPLAPLPPAERDSLSPLRDQTPSEAAPARSLSGATLDAALPPSSSSLPGEAPPLSSPSAARVQRLGSRFFRAEYLTAGVLLPALVLGAFALGRLRATSDSDSALIIQSEPAQQIKSGLLPPPPTHKGEPAAPAPGSRDLPVIPFAAIEVEPANAEVWLDHALVGLGRIELAPISDGALHELRFVADGHATRSLFFIDAPPAGRVILERTPAAAATGAALENPSAEGPANPSAATAPAREESEPVRRMPHRRAAAPVAAAQRQQAPAEPAAPARSGEVKKAVQVQLIEARVPHVQVVE